MGYINCLQCGCRMSDKSEKCPECGLSVGAEMNGVKRCPECGNPVKEETVKCNECGFVLMADHSVQPTPEIAHPPKQNNGKKTWIIFASAAFLLIGGAAAFFLLNKRGNADGVEYIHGLFDETMDSRQSMAENAESHHFTFAERTWLRSSPNKFTDANKLKLLQYGSCLVVIHDDGEWSRVREVSTGDVGYVASDFLLNQYKFTYLNSLFPDSSVRSNVSESKYRKALLQYAENNDMIGGHEHDAQLKPLLKNSIDSYKRMQVMEIAASRKNDLTGDELVEFKIRDIDRGINRYITFSFDGQGTVTAISSY